MIPGTHRLAKTSSSKTYKYLCHQKSYQLIMGSFVSIRFNDKKRLSRIIREPASRTHFAFDSVRLSNKRWKQTIMSSGEVITCRAAVCWKKGEELKIEEIQVQPPVKHEVRVKIIATSLVCSVD